jgi:hypothetical protein
VKKGTNKMVLKKDEFDNLTKYIQHKSFPIFVHDIIHDLIDTVDALYKENESLKNGGNKNRSSKEELT